MNKKLALAAVVLATGLLQTFGADPVPPVVTNLVSAQRPGTFLVDITYDLIDPDSTMVMVRVDASSDGGTNYSLPATSLSGDVGWVAPGTGKKIVWNAWNDWAGNYTTNAKVRLIADDTGSLSGSIPTNLPPANPNFVWITPGAFRMGSVGRLVWLTKPYLISRYEVTQAEYIQVMSNNPSSSTFYGTSAAVDSVPWTAYRGRMLWPTVPG